MLKDIYSPYKQSNKNIKHSFISLQNFGFSYPQKQK